MKTFIAMTAAALIATTAGQAFAQPSHDTDAPRVAVSYGDLNLNSTAGRATMQQRIEAAVTQVCPERPAMLDLSRQSVVRKCRETARGSAERQLASIYSGRNMADATVRVSGAGH